MWYDQHYYYWGMNWIWWFVWFILLIWIFAVPYPIPGQRSHRNAFDILKRRFASGEITEKEYEEQKAILRRK